MVRRLLSVSILCCSGVVGYAQNTVTFHDYAVPLTFHGRPAPPLHNTQHSHTYRTMIRVAVADGPNFADHYTIAKWGCGSGCGMFSIVDATDSRVYDFPFSVSWVDEEPYGVNFRRDSTAVHIIGELNEDGDSKDRWYVWDGRTLMKKSEQPPCHVDKQNCGNKEGTKAVNR